MLEKVENFQELIGKCKKTWVDDTGKDWILSTIRNDYKILKMENINHTTKLLCFESCYTFLKSCYLFNIITSPEYHKIFDELEEYKNL